MSGGVPLPEPKDECSQCHPELPPREPKLELVPNWEANPEEYDTLVYEDGERVPCIKDWAKGEFERRVAEGPVAKSEEAEQIERKRAFARERSQHPMTEGEVQRVKDYVRGQMELVDRMMGAQAAGLVLP
jgi:hypothetical protein